MDSVLTHPSTIYSPSQVSPDLLVRFLAKVSIRPGACHQWTGALSDGYGSIKIGANRGTTSAHRIAYVMARGSIEPGLVLDHLCRNRACVNPDHLEAVTNQVNLARGETGIVNRSKTTCPQGHPYDGPNLYVSPRGGRFCRTCTLAAKARYRARIKAARLIA